MRLQKQGEGERGRDWMDSIMECCWWAHWGGLVSQQKADICRAQICLTFSSTQAGALNPPIEWGKTACVWTGVCQVRLDKVTRLRLCYCRRPTTQQSSSNLNGLTSIHQVAWGAATHTHKQLNWTWHGPKSWQACPKVAEDQDMSQQTGPRYEMSTAHWAGRVGNANESSSRVVCWFSAWAQQHK